MILSMLNTHTLTQKKTIKSDYNLLNHLIHIEIFNLDFAVVSRISKPNSLSQMLAYEYSNETEME